MNIVSLKTYQDKKTLSSKETSYVLIRLKKRLRNVEPLSIEERVDLIKMIEHAMSMTS